MEVRPRRPTVESRVFESPRTTAMPPLIHAPTAPRGPKGGTRAARDSTGLEGDRYRLRRRLVAPHRHRGDGDQHVRRRVVGGRAAAWDLVRHGLEPRGPPPLGAEVADDVDQLVLRDVALAHVLGVEEDDPAPAVDAAVTVVLA